MSGKSGVKCSGVKVSTLKILLLLLILLFYFFLCCLDMFESPARKSLPTRAADPMIRVSRIEKSLALDLFPD